MLTALELHERAKDASRAWHFRPARRLLLKALERAEDSGTRAAVEGTLGLVEAELGDRRAGLRLIDSALAHEEGMQPSEVGKLYAQRALIHTRLGNTQQALTDFGVAIPALVDDQEECGRARMNRGNLFLHQGAITAAIHDFEQSVAAFDAAAQVNASAKVTHNLGYALMMSGQLARGLSLMDRVAPQLREMSVELAAISDQDRGSSSACGNARGGQAEPPGSSRLVRTTPMAACPGRSRIGAGAHMGRGRATDRDHDGKAGRASIRKGRRLGPRPSVRSS